MNLDIDQLRMQELIKMLPGGERLREEFADDSALDPLLEELEKEVLPTLGTNFSILMALCGPFMPRVLYFTKNLVTPDAKWELEGLEHGSPMYKLGGVQDIHAGIEQKLLSTPKDLDRVAFWVNPTIISQKDIENTEQACMLMVHPLGTTVFALMRGRFIALRMGSGASRAFFDISLMSLRLFKSAWSDSVRDGMHEILESREGLADVLQEDAPMLKNISRDEWESIALAVLLHPSTLEMVERFALGGVMLTLEESNNASYALGDLGRRLKKEQLQAKIDIKKAQDEARSSGLKKLQHALDNANRLLKGATERANRSDKELREARKALASGVAQPQTTREDRVVLGLSRFF